MTLEVRDNYLNLGLNPKFIVTSAHTDHVKVQSVRINLMENLF